MNIFLLDRDLKVSNVLTSEGDIGSVSPFFNDKYIQYLETGADTFEFEMIDNGNLELCSYVAFGYKDYYKLFQIIDVQDTHEDVIVKKVYCETAGLELIGDTLRPREIVSANFNQLLELTLSDTDWQLGNIDEDIALVHSINIERPIDVYSFLQEQIIKYECEIAFRVDFSDGGVVNKYVDAYKKRGKVTNVRFEYGDNLDRVIRKSNAYRLCTAVLPTGKDGLTIKDAEWKVSDGDPCNKPLNQDFIQDEEAFNNWNVNGKDILGHFESDTESPYELLRLAWNDLQERKNPQLDYDVEVALLEDDVEIGDEVYVIDNEFNTPLHLSARVNQLEISFTDESQNRCILSNYKKVKSKITDEMRDIANDLNSSLDTSFMGIVKGGFLSSELIVDGFNINVKNKLVNEKGEEYYLRLDNKTPSTFIEDFKSSHVTITQSFAIDFKRNHIYSVQVADNNSTGNIILTKSDFNKNILGKMTLKGFGHGTQIGLDNIDSEPSIWIECDGVTDESNYNSGTKICRFKFENNATATLHTGNVYELVKGVTNVSINVDEDSNRLALRYKQSGKYYYSVFNLRSVLSNSPILISRFIRPNVLEGSNNPHQGFAIYGNRLYHYAGYGYDKTNNINNTKISCLDLKGNVLYSQLIDHVTNLVYREPEGLCFRKVDETKFELYFGFAVGETGDRKFNIYKYMDVAEGDYEVRGNFLHNNGHSNTIDEDTIMTGLDGEYRRKVYLLYVNEHSRFDNEKQFVVAEYKNRKWYYKGVSFEKDINDAIVGEILELKDGIELLLYTSDYNAIKGENGTNGEDGKDAYTVSLSNDSHTFKADNQGEVSQEELDKFSSIVTVYKGDNEMVSTITKGSVVGCEISIDRNEIKVTRMTVSEDSAFAEIVVNCEDIQSFKKIITLTKVKDGTDGEDGQDGSDGENGHDGQDGYTVILTNESHIVACDSKGNPIK